MNSLLRMFAVILCMTFSACKDDSPHAESQVDAVETEQLSGSEEVIQTTRHSVLRNAPQFLASAAKTLALNPADLSKASGYENLKAKLPKDAFITTSNPNDAVFIAVSKIAATGCNLYLKSDASESISDFVETLASKASFDVEIQNKLVSNSLKILTSSGFDPLKNKDNLQKSKLITCSYIIATKILF